MSTATHSKSWPGWTSQIHTLLSRPHVARSEPDGDHAHDLTSFSCPSTTATHSHSPVVPPDPLCAQTAVLASKEAVARSRPVDGWWMEGVGSSELVVGTSSRRTEAIRSGRRGEGC